MPDCRATLLPCCFSCPDSLCKLVDIHGAHDASAKPHRLWRAKKQDRKA